MTLRALSGTIKLLCPLLCRSAHVGVKHLTNVFHQTVIVGEIVARCASHRGRDAQAFGTTVDNLVHRLTRQVAYGSIQRGIVPFQHCLNLPEYHGLSCLAQRRYTSLAYAEFGIGEYFFLVYERHHSKSLASGTGTLGRVEREIVWCRVAICYAAGGTHKAAAIVAHIARLHIKDHDESPTLLHGRGHTLAQAVGILFCHTKTVHYHLYAVILIAVQLHVGQEFLHFSVYSGIEITLLTHALQ